MLYYRHGPGLTSLSIHRRKSALSLYKKRNQPTRVNKTPSLIPLRVTVTAARQMAVTENEAEPLEASTGRDPKRQINLWGPTGI